MENTLLFWNVFKYIQLQVIENGVNYQLLPITLKNVIKYTQLQILLSITPSLITTTIDKGQNFLSEKADLNPRLRYIYM